VVSSERVRRRGAIVRGLVFLGRSFFCVDSAHVRTHALGWILWKSNGIFGDQTLLFGFDVHPPWEWLDEHLAMP